MKKFFLSLFVFSLLLASCSGNSLKGHWGRSEKGVAEVVEFDGNKVTLSAVVIFIPVRIRGTYKIANGKVALNFTEGLDLETGNWEKITSEDLEELGISNEAVPYTVDGDTLNLDGDDYERLSDEDFNEFMEFFEN